VKKRITITLLMFMAIMSFSVISSALTLSGFKAKTLTPTTGVLTIPTKDISDDGTKVIFFVLKSSDGVIRAAIDACDVCYRSGKGYVQDGDYMVCTNCGRRFASNRINDVKGGCNPAPLDRKIVANNIMISMADINKNSWYCEYK